MSSFVSRLLKLSERFILILSLYFVFSGVTHSVSVTRKSTSIVLPPLMLISAPVPNSLEERIKTLEQQVESLEKKPKDTWDKLNAVSGLISGGFVAIIGIIATFLYNERQRKNAKEQKQREIAILQAQTVQSFMPQLQSGQPKEVEAALLAITVLGNAKLATDLADIYRGEGAISALSKIAASSNREAAEQAEKSLEVIFNSLTATVILVGSSKEKAEGSGFFVSQDGLCVTIGYIIKDEADIIVTFRGVEYKAHLASPYLESGLVLLKVENGSFPVLPIFEEVQVESGEEVFVLGLDHQLEAWSFSSGEVDGFLIKEPSGEKYIKIKSSINATGYGGAPVVNNRSEVVGIVIMKDRYGIYTYLLPTEQVFKFIRHHENAL
jgi:S1-C subfamily serine protease